MKKATFILQMLTVMAVVAGMAGWACAGKLQQELIQESTLLSRSLQSSHSNPAPSKSRS